MTIDKQGDAFFTNNYQEFLSDKKLAKAERRHQLAAADRRAAVAGSPIAHSLSPVLHRAAYAELGLDWAYDLIECDEAGLPAARRVAAPLTRSSPACR